MANSKKATENKSKSNKKAGTAKSRTASKKAGRSRSSAKAAKKDIEIIDKPERTEEDGFSQNDEILTILLLALSILLLLGNFGVTGEAGTAVSNILFGLFGSAAYVFPFVFFFIAVFIIVNRRNGEAAVKAVCAAVLYILTAMFFALAWDTDFVSRSNSYASDAFWGYAVEFRRGGGFIGGHLFDLLMKATGSLGAVIIMITVTLICLVVITGRSLIKLLSDSGKSAAQKAQQVKYRVEDAFYDDRDSSDAGHVHKGRIHSEDAYMANTRIERDDSVRTEDMHEVKPDDSVDLQQLRKNLEARAAEEPEPYMAAEPETEAVSAQHEIHEIHEVHEDTEPDDYDIPETRRTPAAQEPAAATVLPAAPEKSAAREEIHTAKRRVASSAIPEGIEVSDNAVSDYKLPDPSMLNRGSQSRNSSKKEQMETAERLKNTLASFGVNVTMTDISQGPTVTRYEMLPDAGVKVSRIVSLTDDIKLNLAAESIRIEAPIPGKAAIGIEVPNKEVTPVMLHDLIVSDEFVNAKSKISFAVGKDIGGKSVVFDIAKMPHVLIAGATGSGKSVCINTIIMSILFKARPDEVKMIMIDPKVVELSIYNGIPHLMIPVVTDPQKAAGALNWGVIEMDKRYNQFAEKRVRDLKGFNALAEKEHLPLMPQIVIIVDELADLMMVAKNDVETSICRLAQKARAAGIHIIIATQRPSVDVITGLIKANMPSRVAFTVTSGTDSRTILDMVGAEKLLGKGDMLFFPTGYPKPARIQGAFVSDEEVEKVASFCRSQNRDAENGEDIMAQIESASAGNSTSGVSSSAGSGSGSDEDDLFMQAADFAVNLDKENISIGLLQRKFRLGFNRAARIMDQLTEAGIVGEDMGTKGRRIVMTPEKFDEYKEEHA